MENKDGDLASGQALEKTQENNNCVTESSSFSASVQESTMVTLLKTMQEQLQVSNQLLFGLVTEKRGPLSRKRKISGFDSKMRNRSPPSHAPMGKSHVMSLPLSQSLHIDSKTSALPE